METYLVKLHILYIHHRVFIPIYRNGPGDMTVVVTYFCCSRCRSHRQYWFWALPSIAVPFILNVWLPEAHQLQLLCSLPLLLLRHWLSNQLRCWCKTSDSSIKGLTMLYVDVCRQHLYIPALPVHLLEYCGSVSCVVVYVILPAVSSMSLMSYSCSATVDYVSCCCYVTVNVYHQLEVLL